tara:strand:+ start:121 stop:369 length:249 start_codon:yes stop_codon:yes gene_type:complete
VYVGSGAEDVDADADALDALGVDSDALGLDLDALGVVGSVPAALEEWGVSDVDLEGPVLQGFAAVALLPKLKSNLRMVLPAK